MPGCPDIRRRIAIGGRLLIYVAEPADAGLAAQRIGTWVVAGCAERDKRGMNRLRLVVALEEFAPEANRAIETAFALLPELTAVAGWEDPRIHLHCLPRSALASI